MSTEFSIIHPVWLRLTHWLNVVAVVILVMSGWRIYDASPFFAFSIPKEMTLGGWLGGPSSGTSRPCGCWWPMASSISCSTSAVGACGESSFPSRPGQFSGTWRRPSKDNSPTPI